MIIDIHLDHDAFDAAYFCCVVFVERELHVRLAELSLFVTAGRAGMDSEEAGSGANVFASAQRTTWSTSLRSAHAKIICCARPKSSG